MCGRSGPGRPVSAQQPSSRLTTSSAVLRLGVSRCASAGVREVRDGWSSCPACRPDIGGSSWVERPAAISWRHRGLLQQPRCRRSAGSRGGWSFPPAWPGPRPACRVRALIAQCTCRSRARQTLRRAEGFDTLATGEGCCERSSARALRGGSRTKGPITCRARYRRPHSLITAMTTGQCGCRHHRCACQAGRSPPRSEKSSAAPR